MTAPAFLLDTNIVIGWLHGRAEVGALAVQLGFTLPTSAVSQITRIEVLGFAGMSQAQEQAAVSFFSTCAVLLLDDAVERTAIEVRRRTRLKLPDAIIAATAKANSLQLVTLDQTLVSVFKALP